MLKLITLSILAALYCYSVNAADQGIEVRRGGGGGGLSAYEGTGGIAISTNSGRIVIDGSAIAAGATPAYAITNRQSVGSIFTNFALLKQNNHITLASNIFVSGTNIASSLRITNDTYLGGTLLATNGAIIIGQDAIPITFGGNLDFVTGSAMTNWYPLYQMGSINLTVSGVGTDYSGSSQSRFRTGTLLQMDSGSRLELDYLIANRVMITGAGSMATNHPDMRLAVSLSGAADTEVLGYHAASGTWTNQTAGAASAAGNNGEVQFKAAGVFSANTNFTWEFGGANPTLVLGRNNYAGGNARMEVRAVSATNILGHTALFSSDGDIRVGVSNNNAAINIKNNTDQYVILEAVNGLGFGGKIDGLWYLMRSTNMFADISFHTPGTITANQFSTTNATPGSTTSGILLYATNLTVGYRIQGSHQMTRFVTNIVGILEVSTNDITSTVFTIDCDKQHEVNMTNRLGFAFTAMVTNGVPGQRIKGRFIGTVSGGANHIVTFAGQGLFLNSYDISVAPATSLAVTITNGYLMEYDIAINKDNGTNTFDVIYAYKKY